MFPYGIAKKLPVYFYGSVKFASLKGTVKIEAPIKRAMIGFGQAYEMNKRFKGIAELHLRGNITFKGYVQFGNDYFIYVEDNAFTQFGNMSSIGSNGKLICTLRIILGDYARIGSESNLIDTNFHQMINTVNNHKYDIKYPIEIGCYNYIGTRVSIMPKTKTPNYCTIASNSLCNKDYTSFGTNILIGGIPAKLLKDNISRDWEGERKGLENFLIMKNK